MFTPSPSMDTVLACVDAQGHPSALCDGASWVARTLSAPLTFLHVLDGHADRSPHPDFSASTDREPGGTLTQALNPFEAHPTVLGQAQGQQLLEGVRGRALHYGLPLIEVAQRQGELADALIDLQAETRLIVMGLHAHRASSTWRHPDHHIEQALHTVPQPILVITQASFAVPSAFALAYDGSESAQSLLEAVTQCELLRGMPCHLLHIGANRADMKAELTQAAHHLAEAGFSTHIVMESGRVEQVLARHLAIQQLSLLVMGASGHSRLRHLLTGSHTSTILRTVPASVLVLR